MECRRFRVALALVVTAGMLLAACSEGEDASPCGPACQAPPAERQPLAGRLDVRGIIHGHSIYSHDACDGRPEGNTECLMELREAVCTTGQDYFLLTDHRATFAEHPFPDVLLYLPEEGDELVLDGEGRPFANEMGCAGGSHVILMAGTENALMPVHLHRHADGTAEDRMTLYGRDDPDVLEEMHALGGSVIVNHSEGWSPERLIDLAPDGIEVFNLHAAIAPDIRPDLGLGSLDFVPDLLGFLLDPGNPDPDLAIVTFWPDTQAWNERWDALLAVQRCYGIAGTDAHRNALPFDLSDGDRADSYRRMMQFFNNHLLVDDRTPAAVEEALDGGRIYVVFDFLGRPEGFDFFASDARRTYEMGEEAVWSPGLTLHLRMPRVASLDPALTAPEISLRILRVDGDGSRVIAEGEEALEVETPGPGAYRAEVHIVPRHLEPRLGAGADRYIHPYPWIYANPIYVPAD